MSNNVYEDVFGIESGGRDSEHVEMMVDIYESADVISDQDFRTNTQQPLKQTGSGSLKTSPRPTPVCLVLLCFLLLTAVIVLSVYIYTNYTRETSTTILTEEKDQLIINITLLIEERDQLLTNIVNITEERDQLLTNIVNITEERDQLLTRVKVFSSEKDQLEKRLSSEKDSLMKQKDQLQQEKNYLKFLYEQDGWFYYQSSFYFISSEEKSWSESRRYCTDRKADLTIINNREEQDFVKKTSGGALVWIGLTDSAKEGSWKWVDGTNMTTSFRFWRLFEPNGQRRENCAASHSSGWADYPCDAKFKWICEKIAF